MSKDEAKQAMIEGKKVTHVLLSGNEWWKSNQSGTIVFNNYTGTEHSADWFWRTLPMPEFENGWSIVTDKI